MELAIPIIALGSLYIASNMKNKNCPKDQRQTIENFDNYELPNTNIPPQNYPVINERELVDTTANYPNSNIATDKYFNQNLYENNVNSGIPVKNEIQQIYSLTGNYTAPNDFKHNNMVPFYSGTKLKGQVYDFDVAETFMDNMTGSGSQLIKKIEQAPLFKPENGVQWAYGTPNNSDFYQSRVVPGLKASNVKPFESEYVAPGLNAGYSAEGRNGFNSGMEARELWQDKTVDELRSASKPKVEFSLNDHQGPSYAHIQNVGKLGQVEKFRPDTFFIQNQDRWLTTTGQEKGPMLHPIEEVHSTQRMDTTCSYTGNATTVNAKMNYAPQNYEQSRKPETQTLDVPHSNASNRGDYRDKDMWLNSHSNYENNRSTVANPDSFRSGFSLAIGAVVSPLLDILNPTKREEYTSNKRIYGDATSRVPRDYVYNPADTTKTTIKETTLYSPNLIAGSQLIGTGYLSNPQCPTYNVKEETSCSYVGSGGNGASTGWGGLNLESQCNQIINENKEPTLQSRIAVGNTNMFNNDVNVSVGRYDQDRNNNRMWVPSNLPSQIISAQQYGEMRKPLYNKDSIQTDRLAPEIVNQLKANPYAVFF